MSVFTLFSIMVFFFLFFLSQEKQKKRKPPTLRNAIKTYIVFREFFLLRGGIIIRSIKLRFFGLFQWFNSLRPRISQEHGEK